MKFIESLIKNWDVLIQAPIAFVLLAFICFVSGWAIAVFFKKQEISNLKSERDLNKSRLEHIEHNKQDTQSLKTKSPGFSTNLL